MAEWAMWSDRLKFQGFKNSKDFRSKQIDDGIFKNIENVTSGRAARITIPYSNPCHGITLDYNLPNYMLSCYCELGSNWFTPEGS